MFLGRAVDRRFLPLLAFFVLVDFDFFARGIITSVLSIHSVGTALQSQEGILTCIFRWPRNAPDRAATSSEVAG